MKLCSRCSAEKPLDQFYRSSSAAGGRLHPWCKACLKVYNDANRAKRLADPVKAERARELSRQRAVRSSAKVRREVIEAYGSACNCCGETTVEFLTIDHINNDGADHRRELTGHRTGSSTNIYRWLRANGYPKDNFQLLCYNCNCAKGFYGTCPHVLVRTRPTEMS